MEITPERRLLLAVALALGVLVLWQVLFPAPPPPVPPTQAPPAGPVEPSMAGEGVPAPPPPVEAEPVPAAGETEERTLTLETDDALVMVTNRGGRVLSWKLKRYKDDAGRNLEVVPEAARRAGKLPLGLVLDDAPFAEAANRALYSMERLSSGPTPEVEFNWADGTGRQIRKSLRIDPDFEATLGIEVRSGGQLVPARVAWGAGFGEPPVGSGTSGGFAFAGRALVQENPKPLRIAPGSLQPPTGLELGTPRMWAGLEDTYFTALLLPPTEGRFSILPESLPGVDGSEPVPALSVAVAVPVAADSIRLYVGPKDYKVLQSKGAALEEVVHFQSGIWVIGPLVTLLTRGLFHALIFLHDRVMPNWGVAIIILTVVLKLIFWPITQKSMLSMKKLQEKTKKLQPKVAAIKDRFRRLGKKDIESRQKMNQEIMEIYQKAGVNPMGNLSGCLPLLMQLPILYAFYGLLQVAIELRQAPFMLWIHDLSKMDPYYVLPVVMGGTMVAQQVLSGTAIPDPVQRRIMYLTPVMFTLFFLNLPSGLVLYWLVNNLLGIAQQYMVNRRHGLDEVAELAASTAGARKG